MGRRLSKAEQAIAADSYTRERVVEAVRYWHANRRGCHYSEVVNEIDDGHRDVISVLQWRAAASNLIAKVCSVLGETTVPVIWTNDVPLGATDGETIMLGNEWFNEHILEAILERRTGGTAYHWGEFKAMSFHELSHIIWTPRFTQKPCTDLRKLDDADKALKAMNILEDQRIESLFVARYAPSIPLFTHLVSKHIVELGDSRCAHMLTHGRKYLPLGVRQACRDNMAYHYTPDIADRFSELIDTYREVVFPNDHKLAYDLIIEFVYLCEKAGIWNLPDSGSSGHERHRTGRPESVGRQRKDQEARERSDERQEAEDSDDVSDDDTGDQDSGDETMGNDSDAGGDDATGDDNGGHGGDKTSGESARSDSDDDGNPGAGVKEAFEELAEQTKDRVIDDGQNSIKSVVKSMDSLGSEGTIPTHPDERGLEYQPNTAWMNVGAKRLQEKIGLIFNDYEERWVTGLPTGRLNVTEAMNARGTHFDVFDQFMDSDEEATSFEVVILVDRSGSMGRRAVEDLSDKVYTPEEWRSTFTTLSVLAQQAMWTIRYAFQSLEIPVTVIGYDSGPTLMAAPWTTPATRGKCAVLPPLGSTNPDDALKWAKSILTSTNAKNKLLITLTDGEWFDDQRTLELVRDVRNIGGQTLLVAISPGYIGDESRNRSYTEAAKPNIEADDNGRHYGHDEYINLAGTDMRRLPDEIGERIARLSSAALVV